VIEPTVEAWEPDVDALQVARVYADALWRLAVQQKSAAALIEEYHSLIEDVLNRNVSLEKFFGAASVSRDRRDAVLDAVFGGRASPLLVNFLKTLSRHDRLALLREIAHCLDELWGKSRGLVPVLVRTATPLAGEQLESVRSTIQQRFGIQPDLAAQVDPSLLGGLWVRIGDVVYDRSVRCNLRRLKENLLTRSSHEIQSG
jgi:F-type H+-transporting ATPase subunit delta